ncbi:MAG: hypothetical protein PHP45_06690 [Elusimicrobiales bacterium]|nr:hypothetical protein [Elusimicrobiales bacterium]
MNEFRNIIARVCVFAVSALFVSGAVRAGTLDTSNSALSVELRPGWASAPKEDDPDVLLRVKRGGELFFITALNQDLGDHYLEAKLKDEINSLRGRGYTVPGSIEKISIHSAASLFYTSYSAGSQNIKIGYFTYDDKSYGVSATDVGEAEFGDMMFSIRKKGEPAPVRPAPARVAKRVRKPRTVAEKPVSATEVALSSAALPAGATEQVAVSSAALLAAAKEAHRKAALRLERPAPPKPLPPPLIPRHPLPIWVWGILAGLWALAAKKASDTAKKLSYPKLEPLPRDVPADFFFPFIIKRFVLPEGELQYSVVSRQGQRLSARYDRGNEAMLAFSVYAIVVFHALWSLAAVTGVEKAVLAAVLPIPGGTFIVSVPELPFTLLIILAALKYSTGTFRLTMTNHEEKLLLEAFPAGDEVIIRDGKGKEAGLLKRSGSRNWQFLDADEKPVFELKDDQPKLLWLRRICGTLDGALRARYSIFVKGSRAGFVLNDPSSPDGFQIHLEYGYGRITHPAHIVACVLYALARNREYPYPWPV